MHKGTTTNVTLLRSDEGQFKGLMPGITPAPVELRLPLPQSIASRGDGGSSAEQNSRGWRDGEGMEAVLEGTEAWLTWIGA